MKHKILMLLPVALLVALPAAGQGMGALSAEERTELVELLERSRSETEELAARAEGDTWSSKPAEDRWSVGEVVEHIILAEEALFATATGALEEPEDPDWEQMASGASISHLVGMFQDRSQKFPAPPQFVPKGEMSREEVLKRFAAVRAVSLDFARRTQAPLKRHTAEGPAPRDRSSIPRWR